MSIKSVNNVQTKYNDNCNCNSNIAKCVGLGTGTMLASGLVYSQMNSLKTISGKKNLIEGLMLEPDKLKLKYPRNITRDSNGKIIKPLDGVTERSKKIVKDFKKHLYGWGVAIIALSVGLGALADGSITKVNKKELLLNKASSQQNSQPIN